MSTKWPWVMFADDFTLSLRKSRVPKVLLSLWITDILKMKPHHMDFSGSTVHAALRKDEGYLT